MDKTVQELANKIKNKHKCLSEVPIEKIEYRIKTFNEAGISDKKIEQIILKIYALKNTVDKNQKSLINNPNPKEILVHDLPEHLDRKDWS